MEAERLGHRVLVGTALETPATAKAFRMRAERAPDRRQLHAAAALAGVTGLLVLIGRWVDPLAAIALFTGGFLVVLVGGIWQQHTRLKYERRLLATRPWQVWPASVHKLRARTRAGATVCRVDLLARNGAVVRSGKADLPTALWDAMTDGVGTLWICGDLRQPYLVAAPGGIAWTLCHPEDPPEHSVHITIRT
ncbi:hypothetical protein ACFWXO_13755 [Kitasatospora sp. NPDC059088]|uniref:hypothetical protein n=1 Tax=Kitasatospora sp. NPDC059088 TaxID=3346722 RepID=UPI0036C9C16A